MNMNEPPQADATMTELNRQLLEFVTNCMLGALLLFAVGVFILALAWCWDALRERRQHALVQDHLRVLAASDGVCPPVMSEHRGHIWRFHVRRWTFALSVDQIEKSV